jgi:hypothetical protein
VSRRHEYFCPRDETDLTTAAAPAAPTPSRWGPFSPPGSVSFKLRHYRPPWIGIQVRRGCYTNRASLLGRAIRNGRQHSSQPENTPVKPRRALQRAVSKRAAPFGSPSRPRIGRFRRGLLAVRVKPQLSSVCCPEHQRRRRLEILDCLQLQERSEPKLGSRKNENQDVVTPSLATARFRPIGHKRPPGGGGVVTCAGPREGRIRDHEVPRP